MTRSGGGPTFRVGHGLRGARPAREGPEGPPRPTGRSQPVVPMPGTIAIGAFVFGAVLLLIAFVGGGFKVFGAEVSGGAKPAARGAAGVLGLLLILFGIGKEEATPSGPDPAPPLSDSSRVGPAPAPIRPNGLGVVTDPKTTVAEPGPDLAAVREEAVAAVHEALDVQVRAMNEGTGDELDDMFEGTARAQAAVLPAAFQTVLQQNGVDPMFFQANGGTMTASTTLDEVVRVEANDAGSQADVRFRYTLRIRMAGPMGCMVLRQNPHTDTYRLNRTADGWRVYETAPPTVLPWSQEPC